MAYNMMNPGRGEMKAQKYESVQDCLDHVITSFKKCDAWNGESEKCAVYYDFRGVGRMHEKFQEYAQEQAKCFGKQVADKPHGIITMPYWDKIATAGENGYFKDAELHQHFNDWKKAIEEECELFTNASMYLSECGKLTLYNKVYHFLERAENQLWAIEVIIDRITPDNYQHPDIKQVFEKLHTYFKDYDISCRIDFDI